MLCNRFAEYCRVRMLIAGLLAGAFLIASSMFALAQTTEPTTQPDLPIRHIVAEGENLTLIAEQYEVTVEALRVVNNLRNADVLRVGQELVIPGGEGELVAAVHATQLGDSLTSIAHAYGTSIEAVMEANLLVNRDYTPAVGQNLSIISRTGSQNPYLVQGLPYIVKEGETFLEIAARHDISISELVAANELTYPVRLFPGQRLRMPGDDIYQDLPGNWLKLDVKPETILQGDTVSIYVENKTKGQPTGSFAGQELSFTPGGEGYFALIGIDAFTEPGTYTLELGGVGDEPWSEFAQRLPVSSANYITQTITVPAELNELLDPQVRQSEDQFLHTIFANFTEEQRWDGLFQVPVTDTVVTAYYGGGRSYNEGPITIYHTGTDFDGDIGTPVLAAAEGSVVYSDSLPLRGQTVIIDHGLGVMTGYYHLSEIFVALGEDVAVAQPIGLGGSTGLSTGPHLHWDLRIMDVPVDGLRWTEEMFP